MPGILIRVAYQKRTGHAGLEEVPVVTISIEEIDPQPGFKIDKMEFIKRLGLGIIFADPLARMYLSTMAREKVPGTSKSLHENTSLRWRQASRMRIIIIF